MLILYICVCIKDRFTMNEMTFFSALEALVNFAYNGSVEIDSNNVQSLLIGASFLHLQSVKEACCDFLKKR